MKHLEMEYKWDANTPGAFYKAQKFIKKLAPQSAAKKLKIKDVYVDHIQGDLTAKKIALRIRNTGTTWEATFKTRSEIKNGKAVRREETLLLPHVCSLPQALNLLAARKKWCDIEVTNLEPKFTLTNKRTVYMFNYEGARLEMALDDVTICVLGRQVKFKEIEVELKCGKSASLDKFAGVFSQQTNLKQAHTSKVKTAEMFLKFWKE